MVNFLRVLLFLLIATPSWATFIPEQQFQKAAFGELNVSELSPVFQQSFEYTVNNTQLTANTVTGGGIIAQGEAMAQASSTTVSNSTALLQTIRGAKYRAGLGGLFRFTSLFTSGVATTRQCIGLADERGGSAPSKMDT